MHLNRTGKILVIPRAEVIAIKLAVTTNGGYRTMQPFRTPSKPSNRKRIRTRNHFKMFSGLYTKETPSTLFLPLKKMTMYQGKTTAQEK